MSTIPAKQKRSMGFRIRRIVMYITLALIVFTLAGASYQGVVSAIDRQRFPPPGQMIDIDGHKMHLLCMGQGSPTVILEAGGLGFISHWVWVQTEIAKTNRVCAYDRGGHGWSDPRPEPRNRPQLVRELHMLLANANLAAPYVLVGHSYGSIIAESFAAQYPDEVIGLVGVDSAALPTLTTQAQYDEQQSGNRLINAPLWALIRLGLARFFIANEVVDYPAQQAAEIQAIEPTNQNFDAYLDELLVSQAFGDPTIPDFRGDLPLIVVTAGADKSEQQMKLHDPLVNHSTNSRHDVLSEASHLSIIANPTYAQKVSVAIRDVIETAQTGKSLVSIH